MGRARRCEKSEDPKPADGRKLSVVVPWVLPSVRSSAETNTYTPDPNKSAEWNHGACLAQRAGHCPIAAVAAGVSNS